MAAWPIRGSRWLEALPLAALLLVVAEFLRAPSMGLSGAAVLLESAWSAFSLSAVALAATAMATARRRRLGLATAGLAGLSVAAVLADAPGFVMHPATVLVGAAVAAVVAAGVLAQPNPRASLLGGVLVLAGLMVGRLHYAVLVGHYPNVHAAALAAAFIAIAVGMALLPRVGGLAPIAGLLLFAGLCAAPPSSRARAVAMRNTELARGAGVARALVFERDQLFPTTLPASEPSAIDDGPAVFAAHSGLPALPPDFDLSEHDVLLVLIDAARHDRARSTMPALRSLARRSAFFTRAMSPSNGTFPSVASMMAMTPVSRAALDIRPRFWRGRLRDEQETAAEAMRAAGRSTFWVGHDHRGCFRDHIRGLEQGFDHVERLFQAHGPEDADVDARIASRAIATLGELSGERFFGLVFFVSPHNDYQPHSTAAMTERERYDAELAFADAQLARLLAAVPDDTVIIVAGDHGEALGDHGHRHHLSSLHREQIHVPLVVHVPGMAPAEHAAPTSTTYVLPWLLARGAPPEREAAARVFDEELGPFMHALSGAVTSEMIGPDAQGVALALPDHDVVYDVFADMARIYDAHTDAHQAHDLREALPRFAPLTRRYRAARFRGQRFRFVGAPP
ncbi:MAG: sulfatase-like hydrolase/transferase [Sandaracinaceae bacterium]